MNYRQRIDALKQQLENMGSPAKLDLPFQKGKPPTQAFSEFLTNKEQGDWAEKTFIQNFNNLNNSLWATKYGRSEDLIAGESGFNVYYDTYQQELERIGKRPDVLVFERAVLLQEQLLRDDISTLPEMVLNKLVPLAKSAIEIRSSAFLSRQYAEASQAEQQNIRSMLTITAHELYCNFHEELSEFSSEWLEVARSIELGRSIDRLPRALGRRSTERLEKASELTKKIKDGFKQLEKRYFLSITPKAEDMSLVYRWLCQYPVPHYYCQVFFDRAVLISFEHILELLADPKREKIDFFIETDEKNQGKTTFKINIDLAQEIISKISLPQHQSSMKELPWGRLLFYVKFQQSNAVFSDLGDIGA